MAAIVPLIAAAVQLGGMIYQGIKSNQQQKKAAKINPVRPTYTIPEEAKKQVNVYKSLANQSTLPAQAQLEDKLSQSTSSAIGSLKAAGGSAQDIIAGATALAGNESRALSDLASKSEAMQRQAMGDYARSLGGLAGYRDQQFNLNSLYPFYDDVARKQALEGAGYANLSGAMNNTGNILNEYANQRDMHKIRNLRLKLLSKYNGGK